MRIEWVEYNGTFTLKIDGRFMGVVRNDSLWTWRKFYSHQGVADTLDAAKEALLDACGVE